MVYPTQRSFVNVVFLKSLTIADELETEFIVLSFDLAFYARPSKYIGMMPYEKNSCQTW